MTLPPPCPLFPLDKADSTLVAFASSHHDCWVGMTIIVKGIVMSSCKTAMGSRPASRFPRKSVATLSFTPWHCCLCPVAVEAR